MVFLEFEFDRRDAEITETAAEKNRTLSSVPARRMVSLSRVLNPCNRWALRGTGFQPVQVTGRANLRLDLFLLCGRLFRLCVSAVVFPLRRVNPRTETRYCSSASACSCRAPRG